ncbi:MAG: hypothetical protein HY819_15060 [Acidobacteria bacterium]|nr:hypothetical protein [Acidobacteriota bacterium]
MSIRVYDDAVEKNNLDALSKYAKKAKYTFGWKSHKSKEYDQGHFNHVVISIKRNEVEEDTDLSLEQEFKENKVVYDVWKNICIKTGKRQLVRAYFNLYTAGTEGYIHIDDPRANEIVKNKDIIQETTLLYLTPNWDPDWAGETVIFDRNMDVLYATLPKYGRVLQFNGKLKHVGRGISRICNQYRVVLALKTYRDEPKAEKAIEFFRNITENVAHSKSTFFSHCFNIYNMLKNKGLEENVCLAGLFHSIYGTESFKSPIGIDRQTVKSYIGAYAESLVYNFCNLRPRFKSIVSNTNSLDFIEQYHLACIEEANLIEQAPRITISSGKIDALKELVTSYQI